MIETTIKVAVLISVLFGAGDASNAIEIGPQLAGFLNATLNAFTVFLIIIFGQRASKAHETAEKVAQALPYVSIGRAHKVEEIINGEDH